MPRYVRNYEREDFTALLNELNQTSNAPDNGKEKQPENAEQPKMLTYAARRRSSLMSHPAMKYVYSNKAMILHDRDCEFVAGIEDENFEMKENFDADMKFCPRCYRQGIIRSGITDDGKRMNAYKNFFQTIGASNIDLYRLIIRNHAVLRWQDRNTMLIHVKEDYWKVIHREFGYELWHNNYMILEDYTRYFRDGFHRQYVAGNSDFHTFTGIMCNYSWSDHVDVMKKAVLCEKMQEPQDIQNPVEPKEEALASCRKEKRISLFYAYYVLENIKWDALEQALDRYQIRVRLRKEVEEEGSHTIFCKVRKRDEKKFLEMIQEFPNPKQKEHKKDK